MENITFISAGAGSGKTFRLAIELEQILSGKDAAKPSGVIGTTFTNLAANELRERVRQRLNERGYSDIANKIELALLGTVNSVCGQLLNRFAFAQALCQHGCYKRVHADTLLFGSHNQTGMNAFRNSLHKLATVRTTTIWFWNRQFQAFQGSNCFLQRIHTIFNCFCYCFTI